MKRNTVSKRVRDLETHEASNHARVEYLAARIQALEGNASSDSAVNALLRIACALEKQSRHIELISIYLGDLRDEHKYLLQHRHELIEKLGSIQYGLTSLTTQLKKSTDISNQPK